METENKEIKNISSTERISSMLAQSIEDHKVAMRYVRWGCATFEEIKELSDYDRTFTKARMLSRVIDIQNEIISISKPLLYSTNPGECAKLSEITEFIEYLEQRIIIADETPSLDDDMCITKTNSAGENVCILTKNYYEIRASLHESFEEIFKVLSKCGLVSQIINTEQRRQKANVIR